MLSGPAEVCCGHLGTVGNLSGEHKTGDRLLSSPAGIWAPPCLSPALLNKPGCDRATFQGMLRREGLCITPWEDRRHGHGVGFLTFFLPACEVPTLRIMWAAACQPRVPMCLLKEMLRWVADS